MYEWFINEWVHLIVLNPETNKLAYFKDGGFTAYTPKAALQAIDNFNMFIENAPEMETNQIEDATKENLPVYILN
jgi:uncharacterized protein